MVPEFGGSVTASALDGRVGTGVASVALYRTKPTAPGAAAVASQSRLNVAFTSVALISMIVKLPEAQVFPFSVTESPVVYVPGVSAVAEVRLSCQPDALAVTLYQIIAGATPFVGKDDEALFNAI